MRTRHLVESEVVRTVEDGGTHRGHVPRYLFGIERTEAGAATIVPRAARAA
jgi:hypothetical protein